MPTNSSAILSQSVLAWLLQATGLLADDRLRVRRLRHVSGGTVKTAMSGEPIPARWHDLVREAFAAGGAQPDGVQLTGVTDALHEWDRRASTLDGMGLDLRDRLPAWLRLLGPQLGMRFGALAALAGPLSDVAPDVQDWLCEPLSPRVVGRSVEWLFRKYRPDLKTWDLREDAMKRVKVNARTVEHWRAGTATVPNTKTLGRIVGLLGRAPLPDAGPILRCARALTQLRADVALHGGPVLAAQLEDLVASYATVTRELLKNPGPVAELAEFYASALESTAGAGALAKLQGMLGVQGTESPTTVAANIRSAVVSVRATGRFDELRWGVIAQVIEPCPLTVLGVSMRLGVGNAAALATAGDPLDLLQAEWRSLAGLRALQTGQWSTRRESVATRSRSEHPAEGELRAVAGRLAEAQRRLCRRPDDPPDNPHDPLHLALLLTQVGWGEDAIPAMVAQWNKAAEMAAVPAALEAHVPEEALLRMPHLQVERARRLAEEGKDAEAMDWLNLWAKSGSAGTPQERRAAAQSLVTMAHSGIDRLATFRPYLSDPDGLSRLPDQAPVLKLRSTAARMLALGDSQLALAGALLPNDVGTADEVERLVALLPLAMRLDALGTAVGGDPEDAAHRRAAPLAVRLVACDRALPEHGPAWAVLALWQELIDDDAELSKRRAEHFGSGAVYLRERARLVADGRLSKDAD